MKRSLMQLIAYSLYLLVSFFILQIVKFFSYHYDGNNIFQLYSYPIFALSVWSIPIWIIGFILISKLGLASYKSKKTAIIGVLVLSTGFIIFSVISHIRLVSIVLSVPKYPTVDTTVKSKNLYHNNNFSLFWAGDKEGLNSGYDLNEYGVTSVFFTNDSINQVFNFYQSSMNKNYIFKKYYERIISNGLGEIGYWIYTKNNKKFLYMHISRRSENEYWVGDIPNNKTFVQFIAWTSYINQ